MVQELTPQVGDHGSLHFHVQVGDEVVEVLANPTGIGVAASTSPGDESSREAVARVDAWIEAQKDDRVRLLFIEAGRKYRASLDLATVRRLPRVPILSAIAVRNGMDLVASTSGGELLLHVTMRGAIFTTEDAFGIDIDEYEGALESAARYLVEAGRLLALGGDSILEQLLQHFWIFDVEELSRTP